MLAPGLKTCASKGDVPNVPANLYQMSDGNEVKKDYGTPKNVNAYQPVITQTVDGFVIVFLVEIDGKIGTYVIRL